MAKLEKLIRRLKSLPEDFTWQELKRLLSQLGFVELQGAAQELNFFIKIKTA